MPSEDPLIPGITIGAVALNRDVQAQAFPFPKFTKVIGVMLHVVIEVSMQAHLVLKLLVLIGNHHLLFNALQ